MPNAVKLLLPDEVPADARGSFNFDSQELTYNPEIKKSRLSIERKCPRCGEVKRVYVFVIRSSMKKSNLSGMCNVCQLKTCPRIQKKGEDAARWKGGRCIDRQGYVRLRLPEHPGAIKGYVFEHRIVMEQMIGRALVKGETVHHKNGIKDDNRPENLELWSGNHGNGQRYEDLSDSQILAFITHLQGILQNRNGQGGIECL